MNEPKSRNTLGQMMELLRDLDDDMLPEEFDPEALIGDIKEKVDAIKWRMDTWKHTAKMIDEEYVQPLQKKIKAIMGKHDRLKDYVTKEMLRLGVEKIPGHMWRVQIQSSTPSLETTAPADASMYVNYPELVKVLTTYKWDTEAIKVFIDAGESFTFATVKQGKHIRFWPQGEIK